MKIVTIAAIRDYGPGMTVAVLDAELRDALRQGVEYYLENGIEGEKFSDVHVAGPTYTDGPAVHDRGLRRRRIEAEATFR